MKMGGPIIAGVAVFGLAFWLGYRQFFATYHLATVQAGVLYRDGVRTLREFEHAASRTHVKTVVSLVDDQEIVHSPFSDEVGYCQANGIKVVRLPVTLGGWPEGDQIQHFLAIATDPNCQPVLVHCAQGVRRTGMFVAAYQLSVLKWNKDQALAAIKSFGHSERTIRDIKRFIDVYDPTTQKMTQSFPISTE